MEEFCEERRDGDETSEEQEATNDHNEGEIYEKVNPQTYEVIKQLKMKDGGS